MGDYNPNQSRLWGRSSWEDRGRSWTSWDDCDQFLCIWPKGSGWGSSIWELTVKKIRRAEGRTPEGALRALLGAPIVLGGAAYYPQDPPGEPSRYWEAPDRTRELLRWTPAGWHLERLIGWEERGGIWLSTPQDAYEVIHGWEGWGVSWYPSFTTWKLGLEAIGFAGDGVRLTWDQGEWHCTGDGRVASEARGATRLLALEGVMGPPMEVLGFRYYPWVYAGEFTQYNASDPAPAPTLIHQPGWGWAVSGSRLDDPYQTPEEAIVANYLAVRAESARELDRTLKWAQSIAQIGHQLAGYLPSRG
jgi:hypothetical protein